MGVRTVFGDISVTWAPTPSILGVVARQSEEHRCWSVARIILGGPLGDGKFYVSVIRRDGQSDLSGIGRLEDRMLELGAANRPGGAAIVPDVTGMAILPLLRAL